MKRNQKRNTGLEALPAEEEDLIIPAPGAPDKIVNGVRIHPHKGDFSGIVAVDKKVLTNIRNKERQAGLKEGLALNPKINAVRQKKKLPKKKFDMHPVAAYVMCPLSAGLSDIPRFDQQYGTVPTAVANPFERVAAAFGANGLSDQSVAFKFRDPFRSWILNTQITSSWAYQGQTAWRIKLGQHTLPPFLLRWDPASGQAPHGQVMFPGLSPSRDKYFWWCDVGTTLTLTLSAPIGVNFRTTTLARYSENEEDFYVQTGTTFVNFGQTTVSASWTISVPGYYTPLVELDPANITTINATANLKISGTSATTPWVYGHRCTPGLENNFSAATDLRHVAASIMYTNKAAPLYRNGLVCAKQYPKDYDWYEIAFSANPYDAIASTKDSYQNEVIEGFYGFIKPAEASDLEFFDQILDTDVFGNRVAFFNLQNDAEFLAVAVSVNVFDGRSGVWTICDGVEYVTNDVWRNTSIPAYDNRIWSSNMELVSRAPQFFENKRHWKEILQILRNGLQQIAEATIRYGPSVISLAKTAAPFL